MNSLAVSPEFPLPISKYCIVNKPINKPKHHITKSLQSFYFNSEAPDCEPSLSFGFFSKSPLIKI